MYVIALESAVPVSIDVSRPSPMLREIIWAPGANPFFSGAGSWISSPTKLAAAIEATCVPCDEHTLTIWTIDPWNKLFIYDLKIRRS